MKIKYLTLASTALMLAMTTSIAVAQSTHSSTEMQLVPEPQPTVPSNSSGELPTAPSSNTNEPAVAPSSSTADPSTQASSVKPEELQKFASAIKKLQVIEQESQIQMQKAVQDEGLSEERFKAILQAQQSPTTPPKAEVSQEEKQKFEQASAKVGKVQEESQLKIKQVIEKEGLEPQRFNQILAQVEKDPSLQQTVRQMIMKK
jgi:hypothetical protein